MPMDGSNPWVWIPVERREFRERSIDPLWRLRRLEKLRINAVNKRRKKRCKYVVKITAYYGLISGGGPL